MQQPSPNPGSSSSTTAATLPAPEPAPASKYAEPLLRLIDVAKTYPGNAASGRGSLTLFSGLNLEIRQGELVAIVGQSGSGKSTLLHMLGALDAPSAGTIYCATTQVTKLSLREAARFRNQQVGYVWQFHYLLPEFTAQENVAMPLLARGVNKRDAMQQAAEWLAETGLADRALHRPGELSGGEQQRIDVARALLNSPKLILADEPTGNLDPETSDEIMQLLFHISRDYNTAIIMATHDYMVIKKFPSRMIKTERGKVWDNASIEAL